MDAVKLFTDTIRKNWSPSMVMFMFFLCRREGLSGYAIDVLEKMPKHGRMPNSHGIWRKWAYEEAICYALISFVEEGRKKKEREKYYK